MSFHIGYRDGTRGGRFFVLDDQYHGLVTDRDACQVADGLRRELGREPSWQKVRGQLIKLARSRRLK
jgi:hypothetical protein